MPYLDITNTTEPEPMPLDDLLAALDAKADAGDLLAKCAAERIRELSRECRKLMTANMILDMDGTSEPNVMVMNEEQVEKMKRFNSIIGEFNQTPTTGAGEDKDHE